MSRRRHLTLVPGGGEGGPPVSPRHHRKRRELKLPRPRDDQAEILDDDHDRKVLVAGRRYGKTTTGIPAAVVGHGTGWRSGNPVLKGALQGGRIWWVVPDMRKTGRDRWRDLKRACVGVVTRKHEVEFRLEFPGGGSIEVRSADDPDSLRGAGLDGVVIDEASLMGEDVWAEALRAALSDRHGWAMFLYTPKGKTHWTWELFLRGASDELAGALGATADELEARGPARRRYCSWHRPSSANPMLGDEEIADALVDLGSLRFEQEYLARFVVVAGHIFKAEWFRWYDVQGRWLVLEGDVPQRIPLAALRRRATVDLAVSTKTSADYTVILTYGLTPEGALVVLDVERRRMEGPDIVPALRTAWLQHRHGRIGVEKAATQLAIVQEAQRAGLPVVGIAAHKDKMTRAAHLTARMEAGKVFFPRIAHWLDDLRAELLEFDTGTHDDQVDALAYAAIDAAASAGGGFESV